MHRCLHSFLDQLQPRESVNERIRRFKFRIQDIAFVRVDVLVHVHVPWRLLLLRGCTYCMRLQLQKCRRVRYVQHCEVRQHPRCCFRNRIRRLRHLVEHSGPQLAQVLRNAQADGQNQAKRHLLNDADDAYICCFSVLARVLPWLPHCLHCDGLHGDLD